MPAKRLRTKLILYQSLLCFLLLSSCLSFSSTFTATLKNGTGTTVTTAYLHFELWNCGTNFPTVNGQPQTIVQFTFDLHPSATTGVITGTVIGNDQILCGNVASTEWIITPMFGQNQPFGPSHKYVICDSSIPPGQSFCSNSVYGTAAFASLDPTDGSAPPSPGFNPVYSNPLATQTLDQPAGTQLNFQGTVNFCSATVLCGGGGSVPTVVALGSALVSSGISEPPVYRICHGATDCYLGGKVPVSFCLTGRLSKTRASGCVRYAVNVSLRVCDGCSFFSPERVPRAHRADSGSSTVGPSIVGCN